MFAARQTRAGYRQCPNGYSFSAPSVEESGVQRGGVADVVEADVGVAPRRGYNLR